MPADGDSRVALLPHVERTSGGLRFCGEDVEGLTRTDAEALLALERAAVGELGPDARSRVERARGRGLAVLVPDSGSRGGVPATIVVSPHPDDAVLALGAALAGCAAVVLDVFSHETWTPRLHYARRPALAAELILREEELAGRILGFTPVFGGLSDAPLRGRSPFVRRGAVREPSGDDAATCDAVRGLVVAQLERHPDARLLAPLAIGGHVDHVLCREAVLDLVDDGSLSGERVSFYEDLPYGIFAAAGPELEEVSARLGPLGMRLIPTLREARAAAADAKVEALRAYRVQLRDGMRRRVVAHGRALASTLADPAPIAERVWDLAATGGPGLEPG